ncbi:hypothetical protein PpBr36_03462 [Pyricularia pennisetigena]|uniref:hypothetical protein n=1 Tax=Pyricularia pennisetigena TaxID=1578925 RepID=UPI001154BC56|nr:hypothetical protein PpBr36_03462 [Pyricularia pennisetigena]TLS30600.1 hypothetical protein PpBr36_03462 [Pyricularia pennisetigena]
MASGLARPLAEVLLYTVHATQSRRDPSSPILSLSIELRPVGNFAVVNNRYWRRCLLSPAPRRSLCIFLFSYWISLHTASAGLMSSSSNDLHHRYHRHLLPLHPPPPRACRL